MDQIVVGMLITAMLLVVMLCIVFWPRTSEQQKIAGHEVRRTRP